MANAPSVTLVYLAGDSATIRARLSQREKHYMKPAMLDSQLDALEVPANAIILHIGRPPTVIVAEIIQALVDC